MLCHAVPHGSTEMQIMRQAALGTNMPDQRSYKALCPGCGAEIIIWSSSPVDLGFLISPAETDVQKTISKGCRQNSDGNEAVGD